MAVGRKGTGILETIIVNCVKQFTYISVGVFCPFSFFQGTWGHVFCSSLYSFTQGLDFLFFPSQFYMGSCFPVLPLTVLHRVLFFCSSLHSFTQGLDFLVLVCSSLLYFMSIWAFGIPVLPFMVSHRVMTFFSSLYSFMKCYDFLFFP